MSIGDEIRTAREAAGLTKAELADRIGFSDSHLTNVEAGSKNPSYQMVDALEGALGVRLNADPVDADPQDVPSAPLPPRSTDRPPRAKKATGAKKAAPKAGMPSLQTQLQMPYMLASTALRGRLPATSNALAVQAGPCAAAWDQFLLRYPALRDKIEQGAVAADVVNLVMAHVPIVQVAREEMALMAQMAEPTYDGGIGGSAAA